MSAADPIRDPHKELREIKEKLRATNSRNYLLFTTRIRGVSKGAVFVGRAGENQQIDLHSDLFWFSLAVSERKNIWETELVKRI